MDKFHSLKKNRDFQAVYREGKSYANQYLVMYVKKRNDEAENRIGISVSKKSREQCGEAPPETTHP